MAASVPIFQKRHLDRTTSVFIKFNSIRHGLATSFLKLKWRFVFENDTDRQTVLIKCATPQRTNERRIGNRKANFGGFESILQGVGGEGIIVP